jgi:hypothetical protein
VAGDDDHIQDALDIDEALFASALAKGSEMVLNTTSDLG